MKMAKSNLMNKVKGRIYAGLTVGALSFSSIIGYGCGDGPTRPKINYPPVASLYVSPDSGIAPLTETIRASCTDQDNDLSTSELSMNGNVISTKSSLDTIINLTQNSSFNI